MTDITEDPESKSFRESIEVDPNELPDFGDYSSRLAEANSADFKGIQDKNCVGHGVDSLGRRCIYLIPALALKDCITDNNAKLAMMRRIMLLFIKSADSVVDEPYTLVYGHSATPLLAQTAVLHSYYKILPRKYKKNLKEMILLHPTFGVRTFFEISRYFVGEKFFRKLHFIPQISQLQHIIKPEQLPLPFSFIAWEEQHLKMSRPAASTRSLADLASASASGVPQLLVACAEFLRCKGGFHQEGIFRVPGDQILLNIAIDRIRLDAGVRLIVFDMAPPSTATARPSADLKQKGVARCANTNEFKTLSLETNLEDGITRMQVVADDDEQNFTDKAKVAALRRDGPAVLFVQDVNSAAQIFKAFLKEIPEPILCFAVYDDLIAAARELDGGGSIEVWREKVIPLLASKMPPAHSQTLQYVLKFLAEVSLSANINKMTPHNLSIVFSPNMMRPRVDNPATIVEEMKYCVKTVETLLLEHMNESLRASMAVPSSVRNSRMSGRFSTVQRGGGGSADFDESPDCAAAISAAPQRDDADEEEKEEAMEILKEDRNEELPC